MGGRLRDVLGWSGVAILAGALVLTAPLVSGFSEHAAPGQNLSPLVGPMLLLAVAVGGFVSLTSTRGSSDVSTYPSLVGVLGRAAVVLVGLVLVWATFPTRHLVPAIDNDGYRMFPDAVTALWAGVCLVALGMALMLCSAAVLSLRRWKRVLVGLAAGTLAVALLWTLVPAAVTRFLLVEHTVAEAAGEPAPVPTTVSRVGWTWQPEHPVLDVDRGSHGPIVRYADGFVALDGTTGEELWTYRLPYARQVETGVFAGQDRYAYLLHVAEAQPEPETRAMVVLDTATGEVVRDAPMPELAQEGEEELANIHYLAPNVRVFLVYEGRQPLVVAHATDSTERVWEFELTDEPPGRLCLWADNGGIRGHGDRVLVARLCLDESHIPEHDPHSALRDMDVPADAVESVIALDATTGQQVWRHEWTPDDLPHVTVPGVGTVRESHGGAPVALTPGGAFALSDGEPVQARPETPEGAKDHTLAIDTGGAVMMRDQRDEGSGWILHTDASGEVVQRTRIEWDLWWDMKGATVLGAALAVPRIFHDTAERQDRALAVLPLEAGADEDDRVLVGFGDERLPDLTHGLLDEAGHQALAVPGAVVSYLEVTSDSIPLHGLVP